MRFTTDEQALLEAAAQCAGLTVGAFIRQQCIGTPGVRAGRRPAVEREMLAQALAKLGKACGNLNQIARALISGGGNTGEIPQAVAEFRAVSRTSCMPWVNDRTVRGPRRRPHDYQRWGTQRRGPFFRGT